MDRLGLLDGFSGRDAAVAWSKQSTWPDGSDRACRLIPNNILKAHSKPSKASEVILVSETQHSMRPIKYLWEGVMVPRARTTGLLLSREQTLTAARLTTSCEAPLEQHNNLKPAGLLGKYRIGICSGDSFQKITISLQKVF